LIRLTCDPEKLDEISAACQEVISAYVSQGPSGTELASAKLQLLNQIDRDQQSLMYWLNKLARIEFNGSTMESLKHQRTLVHDFPGGKNLRRLVEIYLAPERRINRCLSACLLTREELEQGEQSWRLLHGPFPQAEHLHVH
jgi:predicted Zn-dependent peptidase